MVSLQDMTPLEELERLRAEFLTMVSHELRAPLASIKGSAATLIGSGDSLDPAEALQFHRIIDDQAEHMRSLITDLLDVARIKTGTLSASPESTEPAVLVDQARNSFLSGGGRNHIHIDMEMDLPQVMADRCRIVQVLVNLLNNSARHSPESSVITVSARGDGVHVVFSVADEGVGVPAERLPHLFTKHSRIDEKDPGGIAGSGVGLAICKGIVEA
ncbi:MAG: ATP-binding protein, partial [Chloroflexota bacterium]|nr:ATP-binding protein [Chloroflexota bacterium]